MSASLWRRLLWVSLLGCPSAGAATAPAGDKLTHLSLEDLAKIQVVTVSRRLEARQEVPGAVFVVTDEDIRRTGATTLPDAVRLAPGVQASRIDADEWALAVRGFASRLSRSVLVLIDGRSLWTPLFAGVFWNAQDTLLDDVDRIEVSRGPGGPVYGANAMNGVINVVTKSARDTQGGLLSLNLGSDERFANARWGGGFGETFHHRVYAKYFARDGTRPVSSAGYDDEWKMGQAGFRIDWAPRTSDSLNVHGDLYHGSSGQPVAVSSLTPPFSQTLSGNADARGANAVARWRHGFTRAGELTAQVYFDRTSRHESYYSEHRNTFDVDVQHQFRWGGRHDTVWGFNYRLSKGTFQGQPTLRLEPAARTDDIGGLFANDEVRLAGERLRLSLGARLEWNDYSGWNVQPSARAAWVGGRHTFWGSVTRSLRTSSRIERDVLIYTSLSSAVPLFAKTSGSPGFEPESVLALEAGYKASVSKLLLTLSAFRNRYQDLASNSVGAPFSEPGVPPEPPRTVIPVTITNGPGGTVSGVEASVLASPLPSWRVQTSYSYLDLNLRTPLPAGGTARNPSNSPRHQLWIASNLTFWSDLDLDLVFRAIASIPGHSVPSFCEVDARLAYRPTPRLELALLGRNLLSPRHVEFGGGFAVERAVDARATLTF